MLTAVNQDRRDQVIEQALAVLRRDGPAGLTMRNVAAEAGITATALYRHFADKDALISAVVKETFVLFRRSLVVELPQVEAQAMLSLAFDRFLRFALENPNYYRLLFVEAHDRRDRYPEDFARGRSPAFRQLRDIVATGMNDGTFRGIADRDAADVALTFYAHMHGLIVLYLGGRFPDVRDFQRFYFDSLGRVIKGIGSSSDR